MKPTWNIFLGEYISVKSISSVIFLPWLACSTNSNILQKQTSNIPLTQVQQT